MTVLELSEESSLRHVFCVHLFVFSIWQYSHACQFGEVFGSRFGSRFSFGSVSVSILVSGLVFGSVCGIGSR